FPVLCFLLLAGVGVYIYFAYFSRPAGFDECFEDIAPPRPKDLALPPPAAVAVPDVVRAQALLLPDLPAIKSMPGLRDEAARQKAAGSDALFRAVAAFQAHDFLSLFTADDSRRDEVRKFLFILAGADKVEPGSRGRFIDARELATMERFGGARYLQLGEYPNPAPPAAAQLHDSFEKMVDVYFYMLAMTGAGNELYVQTSADIRDAFRIDLNRQSLDQFIKQSGVLATPAEKRLSWLNALRMVKKDILLGNALLPELDAAIKADLKGESLPSLLAELEGAANLPEDVNILTVNPGAFDPAKLALLRDKAQALQSDKDKEAFWMNVVRLARQGLANGWNDLVSTQNILSLDKVIRETAPQLNLKSLQAALQAPPAEDSVYVDEDGRRHLVKVFYTTDAPGRRICLKDIP
ncbi:MAG TPA: hypothetical protein VEF76_07865, partial [Patescibacteria group bacterium]|nr:hypothetical protein [Patescibacteria group bacterium]